MVRNRAGAREGERPNLRTPGAVVLVSCYELGHQPHGITMPAGFLQRAGFVPRLMDLSVEAFDDARVRDAAFVGISVPMHTALRLGFAAAQRVRALNPDCHICFFGLYAILNADYLLSGVADSCLGGEYETALVELVQALDRGGPLPRRGVATRAHGAEAVMTRQSFALPERGSLPGLKKYAHLAYGEEHRVVGYVEASRGCKHRCRHCPITPVYQGRFFIVQQDVVLREIRELAAEGAQHITFGDPDFLNGPRHVVGIAQALHREFPHLTFDITTKIEHILEHRDMFPELAELGCLFVVSAVESFNDTVLQHLAKGHTRADIFEALEVVRDAGIVLRPSLLPFTPWSTLEEYVDLFDIVETTGLIDAIDPVQYTVRLLVPPGSAVLALPAMGAHVSHVDEANFTAVWTHPDPRMDALQAEAAALVEATAAAGEDPMATFYRLRALARDAAGFASRIESSPDTYRNKARVPRLTEAWFC